MNENDIQIINVSIHKKMTNNHLAQVNFTAIIPMNIFEMYLDKTSIDKQNLGRIRFIERTCTIPATFADADGNTDEKTVVFGRVSHGYGYDIEQDIYNSIMDSKGVK